MSSIQEEYVLFKYLVPIDDSKIVLCVNRHGGSSMINGFSGPTDCFKMTLQNKNTNTIENIDFYINAYGREGWSHTRNALFEFNDAMDCGGERACPEGFETIKMREKRLWQKTVKPNK